MAMDKTRIMVVEDEGIIAKDIQISLQQLGYEVPAVVPSGELAVQKAEELMPDLILMDIVLQGEMDGIEAANRIRTLLNIPVIYLTAYADKKTLERAKIAEPFGYILKPFEERELHTNIETALYKHKLEKEREELIDQLQKALLEVKKLSGLIPICASCKKIRDDRGYWNELETYIRDHSDAEFTHGICPDCKKKIYPELFKGEKPFSRK